MRQKPVKGVVHVGIQSRHYEAMVSVPYRFSDRPMLGYAHCLVRVTSLEPVEAHACFGK